MSVKFSDDIPGSFSTVRDTADVGHQALKDVKDFFVAKCKADDAYAAAVKKLCSQPPGAGLFSKEPPLTKETKTLKDAAMAVLEQSVAIADAQLAMSQKVNEQVIKVLDDFHKSKESEKKKLQQDGNKLNSALAAKYAGAKKAKDQYDNACKSATRDKESAEKAVAAAGDDEKKKKAADKATQKADVSRDKAKSAQVTYEKAVAAANEEREKYLGEAMPATLDALQKLHEERWEQVVSVLKFYTSALSAMPSAIEDAVTELKDKIETQASLDEDLQEFVDAAKEKDGAEGGEFKLLSVEVHDFFVAESQEDAAKAEDANNDDDAAAADEDAADDDDDAGDDDAAADDDDAADDDE